MICRPCRSNPPAEDDARAWMARESFAYHSRRLRCQAIVRIDIADDVATHLSECPVKTVRLPAVLLDSNLVHGRAKRFGNRKRVVLRA